MGPKCERGDTIEGMDLAVRVTMSPKCARANKIEGLDIVVRVAMGPNARGRKIEGLALS